MKPAYVAKKSILPAFTIGRILFCWLIIPVFFIIADIIKLKCDYVEFYDNYVIVKKGVFVKSETKTIFPKVTGVNTRVNFLGFGDVVVDVIGKWDVRLVGVTKPNELRAFLEKRMVSGDVVGAMGANVFTATYNP